MPRGPMGPALAASRSVETRMARFPIRGGADRQLRQLPHQTGLAERARRQPAEVVVPLPTGSQRGLVVPQLEAAVGVECSSDHLSSRPTRCQRRTDAIAVPRVDAAGRIANHDPMTSLRTLGSTRSSARSTPSSACTAVGLPNQAGCRRTTTTPARPTSRPTPDCTPSCWLVGWHSRLVPTKRCSSASPTPPRSSERRDDGRRNGSLTSNDMHGDAVLSNQREQVPLGGMRQPLRRAQQQRSA